MAISRCIKCGIASFELAEAVPSGFKFKLMFVQCAACGGVVGVQEHDNIGAMLVQQNNAIKAIAHKIGVTVNNLPTSTR